MNFGTLLIVIFLANILGLAIYLYVNRDTEEK
jgi:hypothetical protein